MNESDEHKSNNGHKSNDYLGNCCFVISKRNYNNETPYIMCRARATQCKMHRIQVNEHMKHMKPIELDVNLWHSPRNDLVYWNVTVLRLDEFFSASIFDKQQMSYAK